MAPAYARYKLKLEAISRLHKERLLETPEQKRARKLAAKHERWRQIRLKREVEQRPAETESKNAVVSSVPESPAAPTDWSDPTTWPTFQTKAERKAKRKTEKAALPRIDHVTFLDAAREMLPARRTVFVRDYGEYLRSDHWRKTRTRKLRAVDGECERCGKPATEVHHLTYGSLGNERDRDLRALCRGCHVWHHAGERANHDHLRAIARGA